MSEGKKAVAGEKQIVSISCRATPGCTGCEAEKQTIPSSGATLVRFICQTCKKSFHVPMGQTVEF